MKMSSCTTTPCGARPTGSTESRITGTPVLGALPVEQLSGDPAYHGRGRLDHPSQDARGKPVERTGGRAAKVGIEDRHFGRTPAHLEVPKPTAVAVGFSEVQQPVAVSAAPLDASPHHEVVGPQRPEMLVGGIELADQRAIPRQKQVGGDWSLAQVDERHKPEPRLDDSPPEAVEEGSRLQRNPQAPSGLPVEPVERLEIRWTRAQANRQSLPHRFPDPATDVGMEAAEDARRIALERELVAKTDLDPIDGVHVREHTVYLDAGLRVNLQAGELLREER